jgi:hypothetical protein
MVQLFMQFFSTLPDSTSAKHFARSVFPSPNVGCRTFSFDVVKILHFEIPKFSPTGAQG